MYYHSNFTITKINRKVKQKKKKNQTPSNTYIGRNLFFYLSIFVNKLELPLPQPPNSRRAAKSARNWKLESFVFVHFRLYTRLPFTSYPDGKVVGAEKSHVLETLVP